MSNTKWSALETYPATLKGGLYLLFVCMCVIIIKEKEVIHLRESRGRGNKRGAWRRVGRRRWCRYRNDVKFSKKFHSDILKQIKVERPHSGKSHCGLLSALLGNWTKTAWWISSAQSQIQRFSSMRLENRHRGLSSIRCTASIFRAGGVNDN